MPHRRRRQTDALLFGSIAVVYVLTALFGGLSLRQFSSLTGAVAFGGLLYRCIPYWSKMTSLERTLGGLIGWSLVIGAIGSYQLDRLNAPASGVIWWAIAWRVLVLIACACWPWLIGRSGTMRERLLTKRKPV